MEQFPSNKPPTTRAHSEVPKAEEKKVERIVTGGVVQRRKPLGRRLSEAFLGGDARSVGEYVVLDVLIPAAKDTIADAVSQGVERMVFGEVRSTSRRTGRSGGSTIHHTPYNQMSKPGHRSEGRSISRQNRGRHNFDEIVLEKRVEAIETLTELSEIIQKYGHASVRDLYEMMGITADFTDARWGWVDSSEFGVSRVRTGYLLDLPRPEPLD